MSWGVESCQFEGTGTLQYLAGSCWSGGGRGGVRILQYHFRYQFIVAILFFSHLLPPNQKLRFSRILSIHEPPSSLAIQKHNILSKLRTKRNLCSLIPATSKAASVASRIRNDKRKTACLITFSPRIPRSRRIPHTRAPHGQPPPLRNLRILPILFGHKRPREGAQN